MRSSQTQPLKQGTTYYANGAGNAPKPSVVVAPCPYGSADVRQEGDF
jgi:hypothetical protein